MPIALLVFWTDGTIFANQLSEGKRLGTINISG